MNNIKKPILETGFVFGILCWMYVIGMQIFNPESVYWPLAVWVPLRMDFFGEIAFVIAVICFFMLRYHKWNTNKQ